jgi:sRNA-binding regulator protein Hfq
MNESKSTISEGRINEFSKMRDFIAEKTSVKFTLKNSDTLTGIILWFDKYNFGVQAEEQGEIVIPKHAVLWYGPV